MSGIIPVSNLATSALTRPPGGAPRIDSPLPGSLIRPGAASGPQKAGFSDVLDTMVSAVQDKQAQAGAITKQVLLGDTDQLHQGVIAMQEAGVAFSLMVEVRNKLVESYQELMRLPV